MNRCFLILLFVVSCAGRVEADPLIFEDGFRFSLADGWSWIREDPEGWRLNEEALEVRVQPKNMWGPVNDAKNVLVRAVPDFGDSPIEISVVVENRPEEQYEQVNLVWYYDDGHMVKLGQELVDGQLSIVMGREESDRTRTIVIIPIETHRVELRFRVNSDRIQGRFRSWPDGEWKDAGECDLPVLGQPKISLQTYQGPSSEERWVRFTKFQIRRLL